MRGREQGAGKDRGRAESSDKVAVTGRHDSPLAGPAWVRSCSPVSVWWLKRRMSCRSSSRANHVRFSSSFDRNGARGSKRNARQNHETLFTQLRFHLMSPHRENDFAAVTRKLPKQSSVLTCNHVHVNATRSRPRARRLAPHELVCFS